MGNKKFFSIIGLIIAACVACYLVVFYDKQTKDQFNMPDESEGEFFISGWLPYWKKAEGVESLKNEIGIFNEINPFSFEVDEEGKLKDTAQIEKAPWPELMEMAQEENVEIVPTILWTDAEAMHNTFSDAELSEKHIENILEMLDIYDFTTVDIDYEGKSFDDKDNFSVFIKKLSGELHKNDKKISCTVEARVQDNPPIGWSGTSAMSFANNLAALNDYCDSVRIMTYDQMFQTVGTEKNLVEKKETLIASNASRQWVEEVIKYALQYVSPEKFVLGVPTYGWEFLVTEGDQGYEYTRLKSVSFPEVLEKAETNDVEAVRDKGGELAVIYEADDGKHIATVSDAEAVRQKIEIAKKYNLKGISVFKIDGLTDPEFFGVLRDNR